MDDKRNNVDFDYRKTVALVLEKIEGEKIDLTILRSRSPTCGVSNICDRTFAGELVSGQELFAKALITKGYLVKGAEDFNVQVRNRKVQCFCRISVDRRV